MARMIFCGYQSHIAAILLLWALSGSNVYAHTYDDSFSQLKKICSELANHGIMLPANMTDIDTLPDNVDSCEAFLKTALLEIESITTLHEFLPEQQLLYTQLEHLILTTLEELQSTRSPKDVFCNLFVKNLLRVCGQVFIDGQLTINPRQRATRASYPLLVVNGDADINGTLTADNFFVSGTTTLGDVLFDDATVGGNLTVVGNSNLSTVIAGATILSSLTVSGNASVGNTLTTTNLTVTNTATLPPMGDTTIFGTLNVQGATTLQNTLSVSGNTSLSTLSTSGAATLNSASITNNASVGGTLSVTGNSTLSTLSTSGLATLESASISTTLNVSGNSSLNTLSTSGAATLNSASITNNATVGGTLGVTGNATFSTLSTSGLATLDSANVTNTITASVFNIASSPSTGSANLITQNNLPFIHNVDGITNFFAGPFSGNTSLTGTANTAVGSGAGSSLAIGGNNTFLGNNAGNNVSNGGGNVMLGTRTGDDITDGASNTLVGLEAGTRLTGNSGGNTFIGSRTGGQSFSAAGTNNTFIGVQAGFNFRGGSSNIMIGPTGPAAAFSNRFYLGSQSQNLLFLMSDAGAGTGLPASGAAFETLQIDPTTGGVTRFTSSARYKTNITLLDDAKITLLNALRPVSYNPLNDTHTTVYGLIAEEVADVDQMLVTFDNEQRPDSVHYQMLIPLLIKAYQQQKLINEQQQRLNEQLLARIEALENMIEK